jgi:hypothetical protein
MAIKYQPESLMYATEKSTEHLPGSTYDVNEHIKDYCLLANYVEHWSDNHIQREIDYSEILNSMTFVQQQLILDAARQIPWDKVRNTTRKNVIQPGKKFCRSFDLINYIDKSPEFRKLYDQIIKTLKSRLSNFDLFDFDSITVNYNEPMPLHTDDLNKGPSLCFAVGNYRKGELRIHGKDVKSYNTKGNILKYNGRIHHDVAPIEQHSNFPIERYSFIIYRRLPRRLPNCNTATSLWLHEIDPKGIVVKEEELVDLKKIPEAQRPAMLEAIMKEIQGLVDLGTFSLEPMPKGHRPIDSRIVLKVKYRADGTFDKNKARLVARGFLAKVGVDFFSTFSPMASLTAVRILCSIAVTNNLPLMHSDIPQAFIQSMLDSDSSWMTLPKGVSLLDTEGNSHTLVKLMKALYGLKQSPQLWSKTLGNFFRDEGKLTQAKAETCLYYKNVKGKYLIVLSEVDDLVYTGDPTLVKEFEDQLKARWNSSRSEPLSSFLGINIHYDRAKGILTFDVEDKIKALFEEREWLSGIGVRSVPMMSDTDVRKTLDIKPKERLEHFLEKLMDTKEYASVVGAAIFISTACRPDIAQAISRVSRAMHGPTELDAKHVITLLQYLNHTRKVKLVFRRDHHPISSHLKSYADKDKDLLDLVWANQGPDIVGDQLMGMTDADYANKLEKDLKATSGYVFFFRRNLICWKAKLQPIIAMSTHEAELIAMHIASQEAMWLRNVLCDFKAAITGKSADTLYDDTEEANIHTSALSPTRILGDNLGAIQTAANPVSSGRSKHIDIRYLKMREYQAQQRLIVKHIDGNKNPADLFTKPLPRPAFQEYCRAIGLVSGTKELVNENF